MMQDVRTGKIQCIVVKDGDLKKGSKDESNSIENQRLLLHSYIEKQDDLPGEIVEYVDDGYTGTNFAEVR